MFAVYKEAAVMVLCTDYLQFMFLHFIKRSHSMCLKLTEVKKLVKAITDN